MNNSAKKIITETSNFTITDGKKSARSGADLFRDYAYYQAKTITKRLLLEGLLSVDKYDKLCAENRLIFSPFLAEIMA